MAQSAARIVSAVVTTAPETAPSASPSATSAAPKLTAIGCDIERVDTVLDAIGPALAKKLGDPAESWIVARLGTGTAQENRLGDALLPQPLSRLLHPRVASLAQHDPAPMGRGPLEQSLQKAHGRNRADSAAATEGCTSALTSPPKRATSRTRLELR